MSKVSFRYNVININTIENLLLGQSYINRIFYSVFIYIVIY